MTDNTREAFEKWFYDLFPMGCKSAQLEHNLRGAWQAATAQSQERIAEFDIKVKGLTLSNDLLSAQTKSDVKEIVDLQQRIAELKKGAENLKHLLDSTSTLLRFDDYYLEHLKVEVDKAIAGSEK